MQDALGGYTTCLTSARHTASKTRDQTRPVNGDYRDAGPEALDERRGNAKRVRLKRHLNETPVDGENLFCSEDLTAEERTVGQVGQHSFFGCLQRLLDRALVAPTSPPL